MFKDETFNRRYLGEGLLPLKVTQDEFEDLPSDVSWDRIYQPYQGPLSYQGLHSFFKKHLWTPDKQYAKLLSRLNMIFGLGTYAVNMGGRWMDGKPEIRVHEVGIIVHDDLYFKYHLIFSSLETVSYCKKLKIRYGSILIKNLRPLLKQWRKLRCEGELWRDNLSLERGI